MKLVVNAVVVNTAQSMAEALTLGRKAGLDWVTMLDTLAESTIASPWLKAKARLLRERDFTPTMTTTLILKDMDLVLAAAREHGVPMPLAATTRQLLQVLVGEGYADEDYLSSVKVDRATGGPAAGRTGALRDDVVRQACRRRRRVDLGPARSATCSTGAGSRSPSSSERPARSRAAAPVSPSSRA